MSAVGRSAGEWLAMPQPGCLFSAPCGCSLSCMLTWPGSYSGGSNSRERAEPLLMPKLRTETPSLLPCSVGKASHKACPDSRWGKGRVGTCA